MLIEGFQADFVLADKGCDVYAFIEKVSTGGAVAVIPGRKNRVKQREYDKVICKERNHVERLLQKLKHFRRRATGYQRLARNYMVMLAFSRHNHLAGLNKNEP